MTDSPPALEPSRIRALVFDLDGTLVDSYEAIAASLNAVRTEAGLRPLARSEVRRGVGRGLECLIADLVGPEHVESGVVRFREHYAGLFARMTHALPSVEATLRSLKGAGMRMSVASNKPARFGVPILRELGLFSLFDTVQGPDLVGTTKPDPAMLRACLAAMETPPAHAAYVGDMTLDVQTAARAGLPVVLIAGGSADDAELRATGQLVLASAAGLIELLQGC